MKIQISDKVKVGWQQKQHKSNGTVFKHKRKSITITHCNCFAKIQ